MLQIDGSYGEGGGQILRTSLSLAAITGQPIRIDRIRLGRKKPGLAIQHLTAVRAVATLTRAEVHGDAVGSTTLEFTPTCPIDQFLADQLLLPTALAKEVSQYRVAQITRHLTTNAWAIGEASAKRIAQFGVAKIEIDQNSHLVTVAPVNS